MAAQYRITLSLFVLLAPLFVEAQALPKNTNLVGGCKVSAVEALEIFKSAKAAPQFDLYIVCDAANWAFLARKNGFPETARAISVPRRGMIWLGPEVLSDPMLMRIAIEHELEHIRCDCDLDEHRL